MLLFNSDQLCEVAQPLVHVPAARQHRDTPSTDRNPSPNKCPSAEPQQLQAPSVDRYPSVDSDGLALSNYRLKNLLHRRFTDVLVEAQLGHTTRVAHGNSHIASRAQKVAALPKEFVVEGKQRVIDTVGVMSKTRPVDDTIAEVCHQADGDTVKVTHYQAVVTRRRTLRRGTSQQKLLQM